MPSEFARKPRPLSELKRWKATELRQFLMFTGPVVLKDILPSRTFEHFMLLHVALKILSTDELCNVERFNQYANQLLLAFVKEAREIYGDKFSSYNVHNLVHLAADVQKFGPLDSFSAFPFENHLFVLKNLQ